MLTLQHLRMFRERQEIKHSYIQSRIILEIAENTKMAARSRDAVIQSLNDTVAKREGAIFRHQEEMNFSSKTS